jgi:L-fucose isomerase-like protein
MKETTIGLIVGNRGFFPDHLVADGRKNMLEFLNNKGIKVITLTPEDTKLGSVESIEDAQKCANLFKQHVDCIDGIIVTLPNFGDEKSIANSVRWSELEVPILIHAFPDSLGAMDLKNRRDSFCGKISACNNLNQYDIPFSLTTLHTVELSDKSFNDDFDWFVKTCNVIKGMKNVRIGAVGARTGAFNTVRFSEKILESEKISVETLDLSEVFGQISKLKDNDEKVLKKVKEIKEYCSSKSVPGSSILKMAKLAYVLDKWVNDNKLNALSLQCWTAMEEYFGIVPCGVMGMMSNSLIPNACEVDVLGALSMYVLQLATDTPSAIADWNNNYNGDPDRAVLFHCSNFPKYILKNFEIGYQDIISQTLGKNSSYGACSGRIKASPFTFLRLSTDDVNGIIRGYVGEGETTDDPLNTFGGYGVAKVSGLQNLMHYICSYGFEHHVAINLNSISYPVFEALSKYLGWDMYYHVS